MRELEKKDETSHIFSLIAYAVEKLSRFTTCSPCEYRELGSYHDAPFRNGGVTDSEMKDER